MQTIHKSLLRGTFLFLGYSVLMIFGEAPGKAALWEDCTNMSARCTQNCQSKGEELDTAACDSVKGLQCHCRVPGEAY